MSTFSLRSEWSSTFLTWQRNVSMMTNQVCKQKIVKLTFYKRGGPDRTGFTNTMSTLIIKALDGWRDMLKSVHEIKQDAMKYLLNNKRIQVQFCHLDFLSLCSPLAFVVPVYCSTLHSPTHFEGILASLPNSERIMRIWASDQK